MVSQRKSGEKKRQVLLRLDESTYASLANTASSLNMSVNYLANDAIGTFLAQVEEVADDKSAYEETIKKLGGES
jgi:hypothetical protein